MFRVVIPARFGSTRLPGKALLPLAGKPMLQWVYERARRSKAVEVVVATDDQRIASACREFGAPVALTAASHATGTDRIAEVTRSQSWASDSIVLNVQGDEPLIPPAIIDQVAELLASDDSASIATLAAPLRTPADYTDPNVVKVVSDAVGRALYFSRAPIPWDRDAASATSNGASSPLQAPAAARRHIGLYAYRVRALQQLAAWHPTRLEELEKLEQLRALAHGLVIRVADAVELPLADVNTAADLAVAERAINAQR
jgi:3-deoxy-manno-octulosonate cytidylyltransferase (CMP-KDO synthetase)